MVITLRERASFPVRPELLLERLTSDEGFRSFTGFGPIPGIAAMDFGSGSAREVGSVARVTNTDGSTHRERIVEHVPGTTFAIRIDELSSVFGKLVAHGDERFELTPEGERTAVIRTFAFTLRSPLAWPLTVPIVHGLMRAAVRRHHRAIARWAETRAS